MYFVYVIQSLRDNSFYVGKTSNLEKRLAWHNDEALNQGFTHRKIPWTYFFTMEVLSAQVAGKIENHIKRMKSRKYIHDLLRYPEIGHKLIEKYS